MIREKQGFSLVELLITIGIIGVVSAVTIPIIIKGSDEAVKEPALERTLGWLESGLANIINHNHRLAGENYTGEVTTFAPLKVKDVIGGSNETYITNGTTMFDTLGHILEVEPVNNSSTYLSGAKSDSTNAMTTKYSDFKSFKVYKPKKINTFVIVEPIDDEKLSTYISNHPNDSDDVTITNVFIDINGGKGPNTLNKDIFIYGMSNDGHFYKEGSESYNKKI